MTATILYKNFFRYVVTSFNYLSAFSGQAKSWERKKHRHLIQKPLIGFKFVCSGRFSRKQRSSKLICKQGRMPLNTLSANIDYGFYWIPLKNSTISVKI